MFDFDLFHHTDSVDTTDFDHDDLQNDITEFTHMEDTSMVHNTFDNLGDSNIDLPDIDANDIHLQDDDILNSLEMDLPDMNEDIHQHEDAHNNQQISFGSSFDRAYYEDQLAYEEGQLEHNTDMYQDCIEDSSGMADHYRGQMEIAQDHIDRLQRELESFDD